jgi:dienelactone hydrolase
MLRRRRFGMVVAAAALGARALAGAQAEAAGTKVHFTAADGVTVFGRYLDAAAETAPLLLLFHQAGSNKDEYAPIQPWLAAEGYASLAIDQRSGGSFLGGRNETVSARGGRGASYDEAYADLEAALSWTRAQHPSRPAVLCGSSYSAALVFLLAAAHPNEIAALLAFSPGEYLDRPDAVTSAAAQIHVPVFVTSAPDKGEEAAAATILAAVPAKPKQQFLPPDGGVHGSATLRGDANPGGAPAIRQAMLAFLREAVPSR